MFVRGHEGLLGVRVRSKDRGGSPCYILEHLCWFVKVSKDAPFGAGKVPFFALGSGLCAVRAVPPNGHTHSCNRCIIVVILAFIGL